MTFISAFKNLNFANGNANLKGFTVEACQMLFPKILSKNCSRKWDYFPPSFFCKKKTLTQNIKKKPTLSLLFMYIYMWDLTVEAYQMLSHILILLSTEFSNPISRYDVQHGQMGDDFHVVRAQKVLFKASIFYHCSCHFFVFPFAAAHLLEYGIYVLLCTYHLTQYTVAVYAEVECNF